MADVNETFENAYLELRAKAIVAAPPSEPTPARADEGFVVERHHFFERGSRAAGVLVCKDCGTVVSADRKTVHGFPSCPGRWDA